MSALVTAAVTVAATATFTSLGSWASNGLRGAFGGEENPEVSAAAVPATKRVSDSTSALSLTVPESWGFGRSVQDTPFGARSVRDQGRKNYAGTAFVSGTSPGMSDPLDLSEPDIYVAASRDAAADLGLVGASPEELASWAQGLVIAADWSQTDGCTLDGERAPELPGYITRGRLWRDCNGLKDTYRWYAAAASNDGEVVAVLHLQFSGDFPMKISEVIMSSLAIASEKLPEPTRVGDGGPGAFVFP